MKRGGRPKSLLPTSSSTSLTTSSNPAAAGAAYPGGGLEASATVAERLADWQQNLSDQDSPQTELGLPPDPILDGMPELGASAASGSAASSSHHDNSVMSLASSFKDKVKINEKDQGKKAQVDQKKEVTVEDRGKTKIPGGKRPKQPKPDPNLDLQREFTRVREGGQQRLSLAKSNIPSLPASIKDLSSLTEIYLYSNRLATLPTEIGCLTNLTTLALSENVITSLPESMANLQVRKKAFLKPCLSLFKLVQTCSNLFKLVQTCSSLFKP